MEIKTKYSVGDSIFTLYKGKVYHLSIREVYIVSDNRGIRTLYFLDYPKEGDNLISAYGFSEKALFPTMGELMANIEVLS